jgi:hypothetical protein
MATPFKTDLKKLVTTYNKNKKFIVPREISPGSSEVCSHCWYLGACLKNTLLRKGTNNCCVYEVVQESYKNKKNEVSLEEIVKYCCELKCKERDQWQFDPLPHNKEYCESSCPISTYILKKEFSK